ncbi:MULTISPECIES: hypothetical protein [Moorena]|uniref:hypothetical protein n=1 Tax=Moorena TaxID=1155738 RepID=UPI001300F59E|nr:MULTISPECIES: hypothetical protein [Moorena]NEP26874.1 hypothetical protein [Moorena sp. SIO3I6]
MENITPNVSIKNSLPIRPKEWFLVFRSPAIEDAEIQEVVASMQTGWLGTDPKVAQPG